MLSLSDKYDPSSLFQIRKMTFIQKLLLRVSVPFHLPIIFCKFLINGLTVKKNPFHDGKRELSGNKNVASSKDFLLGDVK